MNAPTWIFGEVDIDAETAQNAVGNTVSGDLIQVMTTYVRGQPAFFLGSREIADRLACHVPAENHDLIVKALEIDHAVVLVGPRGSGRETAGVAAMRRLRPDLPIRRFSLEDEDAEEISAGGYLVRAADGGPGRLGWCVDAVQAAGGYLVVIADAVDQVTGCPPAIVIEPPRPEEVCRRRLDRQGLAEWGRWEELPALLEGALPADARRLADLIERIAPCGGDLAARRAEVAHAYRGWHAELRRWFGAHREPHEMALLVAAAALSPAAEETNVYVVAALLARRLRIEPNGAGLAWCPTTRLGELLEAQRDGDRIVFRRYGYAASVLEHALADYPLARTDLLSWLAALPTEEAVRPDLRLPLAERFADLAAAHGAAGLIVETARAWGAAGLPDLAFVALSRTCLHPEAGGRVRRALYEWSRAARTPQTLKLVIARVCEPLGQTYPSIALTRLKHLATHGNEQVRAEVLLAALALNAQGHAPEVLAAALGWSAESDPERLSPRARENRRRTGAALFVRLAGPTGPSGVPSILECDRALDPRPGWRAALDAQASMPGVPEFDQAIRSWLDACLTEAPAVRRRIVSCFVGAASTSGAPPFIAYRPAPVAPASARADLMIDLARRWAAEDHADPARRTIMLEIVLPLTRPWWRRWLLALTTGVRASPAAP